MIVNPGNATATIVIDKDTRYFDWEVAQNVPRMMRILVSIWAVLTYSSVLLFSRKEPELTIVQEALEIDSNEDDIFSNHSDKRSTTFVDANYKTEF